MIAFSRRILDFDRQLIDDIETSRGGAFEMQGRSDKAIGRLTIIWRTIVSGASWCCARFLAALRNHRRKRVAIELWKYRDLIHDLRRREAGRTARE